VAELGNSKGSKMSLFKVNCIKMKRYVPKYRRNDSQMVWSRGKNRSKLATMQHAILLHALRSIGRQAMIWMDNIKERLEN